MARTAMGFEALSETEELLPENWAAWAAVAGGGLLLGYGLIKRDRAALAGSLAGAALLYRGVAMVRDPDAPLMPRMSTDVDVQKTISVQRSRQELYDFWAQADNLATFMIDVQSVTSSAPGRQHWKMALPGGLKLEWDADVTEDPGRQISWRTLPDSSVEHSGAVEFIEGTHPGETYVRMTARYVVPGGMLTRGVAMLAGRDPEQMVRENLRRFRMLMETGEIATTAGQPTGRSDLRNRITESLYHENINRPTPRTA